MTGEMTCIELVEAVTTFLDEALSDANRLRFEAHLAGCPYCRLYLDQTRHTIAALGRLRDLPPLPEDHPGPSMRPFPPADAGPPDRFTFHPL